MELILKETIDSLGREGDVVRVKPGFARNYLLPQGKAVQATSENPDQRVPEGAFGTLFTRVAINYTFNL